MALLAMCSAKGSPGVTVTALAMTLAARRPVLLAECDPAGGDVAAGYLRELPLGDRGLGQLTSSLHRGHLVDDLRSQLVDLEPGRDTGMRKLLLPGLSDPAQAARWTELRRGTWSGWAQLAGLLGDFSSTEGYDILADCGRLNAEHTPNDLLDAADRVLLVLRPELPAIRAGAHAVADLRGADRPPVALVVIGRGPYGPAEIHDQLRVPVVAVLPVDAATARVLSLGGTHHRGQLLRAVRRVEESLWPTVSPAAVRDQIGLAHA